MKTLIIAATLLMLNINLQAQKSYRVTKDSTDGGLIFNGLLYFSSLESEPAFTWMTTGKQEYKPDDKSLSLLRFYLRQYTMVVFMGTWCDDSHNIIPKLDKVLESIKYPETLITMYGVDREKVTKGGEQKKYGITNVPTIILFKDGQETGRITETVKTSVEADLAAIIQNDMAGSGPRDAR